MTLNLRVKTTNSTIHFSDGRRVVNDVSVDENFDKIVTRPEILISVAGKLDGLNKAIPFDILNRLRQDLVFDPNYTLFRQHVFDLIRAEYPQRMELSCMLFLTWKHGGMLIDETLDIINNKSQTILRVLNAMDWNNLSYFFLHNNDLVMYSQDLRDAFNQLPQQQQFDFGIDHNHQYFDGGDAMPYNHKQMIAPFFLSAYYEVKGEWPTSQRIEDCTNVEIREIGERFYQKFDAVIHHYKIGLLERVERILR